MTSVTRQPDKLDYASPTQFSFGIHQLPKVQFFSTAATIPAIALSDVVIPTPFKSIPMMGDQLTYDRLGSDGEIGEVSKATGVNALFSDATLTVLSNKNNPIVNVFFRDLYPIAMSALYYNQGATDVEYLTATVDFAYQIYEIEPIV